MTPQQADDQAVQGFIREAFENNFQMLRFEGGHSLTADVKNTALNQVLLYWRKLRDIAENVTETEVKLSLPGQQTLQGRAFGIEGIVDIVRDQDQTLMYDIKSHDCQYVRANLDFYEQQLNVYAFIWQSLRQHQLDQTAIIATDYPDSVRDALASQDEQRIEYQLSQWDPLVPIPFNTQHVQATIDDFACVVDAIEESQFAPPPVAKLEEQLVGTRTRFGTRVCRNCDARFSCTAYRQYAVQSGTGKAEQQFRRYFDDFGTDDEREGWRTATLDVALAAEDLEELV